MSSSADFRTISPRSITWSSGGRNGLVVASRATSSKPIEFQIPRMNCSISNYSPGVYQVEFKLNLEETTHKQFVDWISDLEESSVGTWSSTHCKSKFVYKNGFRLMFFSDTNVFDSSGKLSVGFFNAKSCSVLCTLNGLWTSASKYGLRFNIKQLKFFEEPLDYPEDSSDETNKDCLFVDDD